MMCLTMPVRVRLALALVTILVLSGCGVRFFYSQLDWLVPWYLRDYVTLDDSQRALLDRRLTLRLLVELYASAGSRQRMRLVDELHSLARQFERAGCVDQAPTAHTVAPAGSG